MTRTSLAHLGLPIAQPDEQLRILETSTGQTRFKQLLAESGLWPLTSCGVEVLQVNVGRVCNQTCSHCHVDAGPDRRESMSQEVAEACIDVLAQTNIPVLDITGGAPEMNPSFRYLVRETRRLGRHVIDRSNLTILGAQGFEDLPKFLADHAVEVVASLPCYLAENADSQRGDGVFDRSIAALKCLNELGYGDEDGVRTLTLVYNPVGPTLPPSQAELEASYRHELQTRYGVRFTRLHTITNMPIGRFLHALVEDGQYEAYMEQLIQAYNPFAAANVMCRTTLSVAWNGGLHDCDFNQMLELPLAEGLPKDIREFDAASLANRSIMTGQHCYGCTAGAGSSCRGAVAEGT